MAKALALSDLPADVRRKALAAAGKKRKPAERTFTVEHERRYALRVLAVISELTQQQRARVLARAEKANRA